MLFIIFSDLFTNSVTDLIYRTGTDYAKYLSVKHRVPLIPIHHMEAHALTARMVEKVFYIFMVPP